MALTSVSFSWRRRSLVVSRTARVMFGREFISIILRNLAQSSLHCETSIAIPGETPYPKISVKNYMSDKIDRQFGAVGFIDWLDSADAISLSNSLDVGKVNPAVITMICPAD